MQFVTTTSQHLVAGVVFSDEVFPTSNSTWMDGKPCPVHGKRRLWVKALDTVLYLDHGRAKRMPFPDFEGLKAATIGDGSAGFAQIPRFDTLQSVPKHPPEFELRSPNARTRSIVNQVPGVRVGNYPNQRRPSLGNLDI
jgi:hypothetical protein